MYFKTSKNKTSFKSDKISDPTRAKNYHKCKIHTDPTMLHARLQPVEAEKVNVSTDARDSALQDKTSN